LDWRVVKCISSVLWDGKMADVVNNAKTPELDTSAYKEVVSAFNSTHAYEISTISKSSN
jgi:hypothetical protein